jgi:hypothetical protein
MSAAPAGGADPAGGLPLFSISKSENKNQVQYAVHANAQCAAASAAPVFAYWRMLEQGATRVAPLLSREQAAYGIASQSVDAEGRVRLVLRAVPSRPIIVEIGRSDAGACRALANLPISGSPAYLFDVYLKLKWPSAVEYLLLRGWSRDRSHVLTEKLKR